MNKAGMTKLVMRFTVEEHGVGGKLLDLKESELEILMDWADDSAVGMMREAVKKSLEHQEHVKKTILAMADLVRAIEKSK